MLSRQSNVSKDTTRYKRREVRIFVSSTFQDMQAEREELVKKIFPELRRRCRERGVEFVEVDLRWGITEEQANRGEVLPICLAEIERCRPYFIGLLGERYGWIPKQIDQELFFLHPWLKEHLEYSITELEILHGVLNNPKMANRAFFYFRDPTYIENIPLDKRHDFISEDPKARAKLHHLKERIRKSGLPIRENYKDPKEVGEYILKDLWDAIEQEYPKETEPSPFEREVADHEAFGESRMKVYIGRKEYFDYLDKYVQSDSPPLIILGESGCGKSALLANWVRYHRERHPTDFVICHYIGSTSDSTDYLKMLRRIMQEIKHRYNFLDDIPTDSQKIREAFPNWLIQAATQGRLILILDALNQLEDKDNAPDLGWLPTTLPSNIRLILSTSGGRSLKALKERNWPILEVKPLNQEECRKIINDYLGIYCKKLDESHIKRIIEAEQTSNPLYLRVLLDELRVFGKYKELSNRIEYYLKAKTIPELFERVLQRLEEDYEQEYPDLAGLTLGLIWASRKGLAESELLEILGSPDRRPLPRVVWSPLFLALEDVLINRSGLLTFSHEYLRQAVKNRYLKTKEDQREAHLILADYFEDRDMDIRKIDELPWQLQQAEEWGRLKDCLCNLEIFEKLSMERIHPERRYELLGYWLAIGDRYDMVTAYKEAIAHLIKDCMHQKRSLLNIVSPKLSIGVLFREAGKYNAAIEILRLALGISKTILGPKHESTGICMQELASVLEDKGNYEEAEALHREALEIFEKIHGAEHSFTAFSLEELAKTLRAKGYYEETKGNYEEAKRYYKEAESHYRRVLTIREKADGPEAPTTVRGLNNLAELLYGMANNAKTMGNHKKAKHYYEEAESLHRQVLEISKKIYGPEHPDVADSLYNLATLFISKGEFEKVEEFLSCALKIWEKFLGPKHPNIARALNNMAVVLCLKGDYQGAEKFLRQAAEIWKETLGPEHVYTRQALNNIKRIKGEMDMNKFFL